MTTFDIVFNEEEDYIFNKFMQGLLTCDEYLEALSNLSLIQEDED